SSLDVEGHVIFDPEADAAFVERLKEKINDKSAIKEVDLQLYTPEFARVAVDEFKRLYEISKAPDLSKAG
ncbi:MAG: Tm-1-like ATP-binding domain-containing protein, partial [Rhodospirillales bacterium]|nr:Tm-1-like ATP-binding domain-containing protein [Rhodospirillales bacterium]